MYRYIQHGITVHALCEIFITNPERRAAGFALVSANTNIRIWKNKWFVPLTVREFKERKKSSQD